MPADSLGPALGSLTAPSWSSATWVGGIDVAAIDELGDRVALAGADGFPVARLLVRNGMQILGFVELNVSDESISAVELRAALTSFAEPEELPQLADYPSVTIAVTTRDRPLNMKPLIESLLMVDYPDFEILIVDNGSKSHETVIAVESSAATTSA